MKQAAQNHADDPSPSRVQIFYNPAAGSASDRSIRKLVDELEQQGAAVLPISICDTSPAIDPQATHICIAGGDGTIRHVAMALAKGRIDLPVAIYPIGTVNLLASEGGLSTDPEQCAEMLLSADRLKPHYPVWLGETMFFACASIGPDSATVAGISPKLKQRIGRLAYVESFFRQLWRWRRPSLHITSPGRSLDCEAVYIAKGRYFAGPWSFAPHARTNDGKLHVVALRTARRRDFLRFAWAILIGQDLKSLDGLVGFCCTQLTIDCEPETPIQADGDIVATGPVHLSLHDFRLNFCSIN